VIKYGFYPYLLIKNIGKYFNIPKKVCTFELLYKFIWIEMAQKDITATLEANVRALMSQYAKAVAEMERLQRKNEEQAMKIRELQQQVRADKEEITRLQLAEAMGGAGDKKVARSQVNRLLREVDKCIAIVSTKM
jgi:replication fork clamp-binding protein CrfC